MLSNRTTRLLSIAFLVTLVIWGGLTTVLYAGVLEHFGHLLPQTVEDNRAQAVLDACQGQGLLCQGLHALIPTLLYTFERLQPFFAYIILSLLALGGWLGFRAVRSERADELPSIPAWALLPLFLGVTWLMFSTLAGADIGGRGAPLTRMVDPNSTYYAQRVPAETLQVLRTSFGNLQARGCLSPVPGMTDPPLYDLKAICSQASFVALVLPAFLFITLVTIDFVLLGTALLPLIGLRRKLPLWHELLLALGLGIGALVAVLWAIAVAGFVVPAVGWILVLGIPLLCYKQALRLMRDWKDVRITLPAAWGGWPLVLGWVLITLFALNFLSVIRPFPIGWDDLGSYLNRPHLLVEYGHFIPKMPSFQWEYITALGFWLFGTNTPFGAVNAMLLNWLAGVLAVGSMIGAARIALGRGGLVAGVFYALLPMVGHFSFADMKIDNAVFLMTALAFICIFDLLFGDGEVEPPREEADRRRLAILGGVFIGLAFGFKVTSAMAIFALLFVIAGAHIGPWAAAGVLLVMPPAFVIQGTLKFSAVLSRFLGFEVSVPNIVVLIGFGLAALVCFGLAIYSRPRHWKAGFKEMTLFILAAAAAVLPWVIHNNIYNRQWPPKLLFTADNRLSPDISLNPNTYSNIRVVRTLPPELALDQNHPACLGTGTVEELDRYWGTGSGPGHYLLLPWRTVMNLDNAGYYITTSPLLLVLPLVLLLPVFWLPANRRLRWLMLMFAVQVLQWMFLANGVLWYGLGMFIGVCAFVELLLHGAPDRRSRSVMGVLLAISLITSVGFRMWQFDLQAGSLEYVIGKVNADVVFAQTIPHYQGVAKMVVDRAEQLTDRPYTLRMGTFIPYFIPRNPEIIPIGDNQLDFFSCVNQEGDPALTTKRLRAFGFNGVIFDFNTASIEQDPNGTLHKKVERFINYATNTASGLLPAVVDPASGIAYFFIQ